VGAFGGRNGICYVLRLTFLLLRFAFLGGGSLKGCMVASSVRLCMQLSGVMAGLFLRHSRENSAYSSRLILGSGGSGRAEMVGNLSMAQFLVDGDHKVDILGGPCNAVVVDGVSAYHDAGYTSLWQKRGDGV